MKPIVTKNDPNGCFQRALPDEPLFTLLARDPDAPRLIRLWADKREATSKPEAVWDPYGADPTKAAAGLLDTRGVWVEQPHPDADQIAHARYVAARMEVWRHENDGKWREPRSQRDIELAELRKRPAKPAS